MSTVSSKTVTKTDSSFAPSFIDPLSQRSVSTLLSALMKTTPPSLAPIVPFPFPARPLRLDRPPAIMQIFNATPDSFSDGNIAHLDASVALERIKALYSTPHPPAILDIGGMSTRPGSIPCSEQEELERVIPLIKAVRSIPSSDPFHNLATIPISVDTYRPSVARAAVEAGASCINDVRGGLEEGMRAVMAAANVPVIIMHSRGDSVSMSTPKAQDYEALGGVVSGVKKELGEMVRSVLGAGVRRWNVVLDPGLGFAKSYEGNLALIRGVKELTRSTPSDAPGPVSELEGLPILVGGSRKGFVGKAIAREDKQEASERGFGDAALVSWCASLGVEIVRVHDGRGMGEVAAMWQAITSV